MPSASTKSSFLNLAVLLGILLIAAVARLSYWNEVFTPAGVRFVGDTDPHYHVLRAERLLHGDADGRWFDRNLSHPDGARIVWPPAWDWLIGRCAVLASGPDPTRADLERAAAFVPVGVSLVALLAMAAMGGAWVGAGAALVAALLAAVLPLHVEFGVIGRPDQHVGELLITCFTLLAFERASRPRPSPPWIAALGVALALGPWVWQGSVINPALLALFVAVSCIAWPAGRDAFLDSARALAAGAAVGATLLGASVVAWGPPDALTAPSLNGLSAFQAGALLAVAVFAGLLRAWERWRSALTRGGRWGRVLAAGAIPALLLWLAFPVAIAQGVRSLTGIDPWLASISEFRPLLYGGVFPRSVELQNVLWGVGPVLFAPLLAIPAFRRRWTSTPAARNGLALLVVCTALFVVLAFRATRFKLYAAPFLPLWAGLGLTDGFRAAWSASTSSIRAWRMAAVVGAGAAAIAPAFNFLPPTYPTAVPEPLVVLLQGLRQYASDAPRRAVLAPWAMGHAIQYYAGLPVVATPFGTDLGQKPMRDLAAFYYAPDAHAAEEILARRQVGFVLLPNPYGEIAMALPMAPPGSRPILQFRYDWADGRRLETVGSVRDSVPGWLWQLYGVPRPGSDDGLEGFRLLYETPDAYAKLFEVVAGARVRFTGAAPLERVSAAVQLVTNEGRRVAWSTATSADADGSGVLRVPYATGPNGAVRADGCVVAAGSASLKLSIPAEAVIRGEPLPVSLGEAPRAAHGVHASDR